MISRSYFLRFAIVVSLAWSTATTNFLGSCQSPGTDSLVDATKPLNTNGRNDAWGYAGPGGGGATFYPAVSPHNSSIAFLSCDMTGSFITKNGGASWRMFNLRGVTHYYVFDPLDSNVVYANAGGLFKSKDGGTTWNLFYPKPEEVVGIVAKGDHAEEVIVTRDSSYRNVVALAIDPENSAKLYAYGECPRYSNIQHS